MANVEWVSFLLSVFAGIVYIYLPGFFIFKAARFSSFMSLISAPVASIVGYGIAALVFGLIGVFTSWTVLFFSLLLVALAAFLFSEKLIGNRVNIVLLGEDKRSWRNVFLYAGFSIVLVAWVYVFTLDGPNSFIPGNDYTTHLNTIQLFIDSGNWSILAGGYYPRGWAEIATLIAQSVSVSAPLAANALNTVIVGIVYPLSVLGFMTRCFSDKPLIVSLGAVCVLAFTAFPWNVLTGSPIAPNVLGFSLEPIAMMLLMEALRDGLKRNIRVLLVCSLVCFAVSCVFTHPNSLFTALVFAVPYCIYRMVTCRNTLIIPEGQDGKRRRIVLVVTFCVCLVIFWALCYVNPLFSNVVNFNWPASATIKEALIYTATLSFADMPAQWIVACLVVVGVIYSFVRRKYIWITVGFLFFCAAYILNITTDGFLKQFVTGFWYTASRRLSAASTIMGVPLLAMGCFVVVRLVQIAAERVKSNRIKNIESSAIAISLAIVFVFANYAPSFSVPGPTGQVVTPFGYLTNKFTVENTIQNNWILDKEEREFFNEVKEVVGADKVLNLPYDGSAFAYCLNQINVYYQNYSAKNDPNSILFQTTLKDVSSDAQVVEALRDEEIRWLLILDYQGGEYDTVAYDRNAWSGIAGVSDSTAGLEIALSQDDMRLYKIDPVDSDRE